MTPLEKLALLMRNNWADQQRIIKKLTETEMTAEETKLSEIKLEQLCGLMDLYSNEVTKNSKL